MPSSALPQVAFYVYPQHMGAVQQGAAANSSAGPVAVRLTDFTPSVMHIRQLNSSSIGEGRAAGMPRHVCGCEMNPTGHLHNLIGLSALAVWL